MGKQYSGTKRAYVFRHGETYWNKDSPGKIQTHSDGLGNMLTTCGFDQGDRIARIMQDAEVDRAYHSGKRRSVQTLDRAMAYHNGTPKIADLRIQEISLSFLDGLTAEEWVEFYPSLAEVFAGRKQDPLNYRLPTGLSVGRCYSRAFRIAAENGEDGKDLPEFENYADVIERTGRFLEHAFARVDRIAVCAHQASTRALLINLLQPDRRLEDILLKSRIGQGTVFRVEVGDHVIIAVNDGEGWRAWPETTEC